MPTPPARTSLRKTALASLLCAAIGTVPGTQAQTVAAPAAAASWAKGRLIVMQRAGLPDSELAKALQPHGGKARRLGRSDLHVVELPAQASETAVVRALQGHPALRFAELDFKVAHTLQVNDPYAGSEWHLPVMQTAGAWDATRGEGVTVAILDTGVLATHVDLTPNLVPGWNTYDNNASTGDVYGHGTAVAGTTAAALNNATGVAGVAGGAKIMPIRVTDAAGNGYYSTIADGVIWAADHGARVANASFGALFASATVASAGAYMKSKGGLLVVSAGNNGVDENAAATTSMIVVSATDAADNLAGWSSYGNMVSVSAPGVGIWTTASDGGYRSASGTSFASPAAAGVVALIMSANPSLSAAQVENVLYASALDLGSAGRDIYFGYGRVNAATAVSLARSTAAADTQKPTVAIASPSGGSASGVVPVDVSATDNVAVTRVEPRVNGVTVATDSVAPFQFSWNSATVPDGSETLTAVAYDAAGNSSVSPGVSLTVSNAASTPDTVPPTVAVKSPADGASVSGSVKVSATGNDDRGTSGLSLTLFIDGVQVTTVSGGSLAYTWNTRKAVIGSHTLSVVAADAAGNKTTSTIQVRRTK